MSSRRDGIENLPVPDLAHDHRMNFLEFTVEPSFLMGTNFPGDF